MSPESLLAVLRWLGPVLLRGIESGQLAEIADTAAKLIALVRPLLTDAVPLAGPDGSADDRSDVFGPRPAQPEDPAMARAAGH